MANTRHINFADAVDPQDAVPLHQVQAIATAAAIPGTAGAVATTGHANQSLLGSLTGTIVDLSISADQLVGRSGSGNVGGISIAADQIAGRIGAAGIGGISMTAAGRAMAGAADAAAQTALLNNFTSTLKGLTPLSGGGTTNFLRADGTWTTPAGVGGISGFTPGSVLFVGAGGGPAQDNANFFWDDTNNRLGIGTASPQSDLDITKSKPGQFVNLQIKNTAGTSGSSAHLFVTTDVLTGALSVGMSSTASAFSAPFNVPAGTPYITNFAPSTLLFIGSLGALTFQTGSPQAERVRILSTGEVQFSSLNAGGLIKSAVTTGQLSIAVPGTDYLAPSGALTQGSVLFAGVGGAVSQDNPNFFWDDTNNRLGIGTPTPTQLNLHIQQASNVNAGVKIVNTDPGTNASSIINFQNGTASATFGLTGTGAVFGGTQYPLIGTNTTFVLSITPGPTPTLFLGSNGVITMQTGSPGAAERLKILTTGQIQISSLNTTGVVHSAVTTGQLSSSLIVAADVTNGTLTNAKLASMVTARFKARITAGTGDPEDITGTQATTLLDQFTTTLKGLAPASGGGTLNFLRADGSWVTPSGTGAPTSAAYVMIGNDPGFSAERSLVGEAGVISITDGGANSTVTVGVPVGGITNTKIGLGFTAGSVVFSLGSILGQNNANFFWDNTNFRLGIGTAFPNDDVDVNRTANAFVGYGATNLNAVGINAQAGLIASEGTLSYFVGINGQGFANGNLPDFQASNAGQTHFSSLYMGSSAGDLIFATGSPTQTEKMRVLNNGNVTVRSLLASTDTVIKSVSGALTLAVKGTDYIYPPGVAGGQTIKGGTAPAESLTLQGTANAQSGSVHVVDPLGVGRLAGVLSGAPMFAVAGGRTINSSAGAGLDYFVVNTSTITITGSTNITNANGFNYVSFEPPVYSGTVAIGSGGFNPPAATVVITGAPTVTGGASFNSGLSLGPVGLWVKASVQFDGSMNLGSNLFMNGDLTLQAATGHGNLNVAGNAIILGNLTANGLVAAGSSDVIDGRFDSSLFVGTSPSWAFKAIGDSVAENCKLGFFSTVPITKPTVSGSRSGGTALGQFLSALSSLGLIQDSTTI